MDECYFYSPSSTKPITYIEEKGKRLHPKRFVLTFKSGYQSVSVRDRFSARRRTPLVGKIGKFNEHTYKAIIDEHIILFIENNYDGPTSFVLQEDNCGTQRAESIAMYLANNVVVRMKWPARSPDLNHIEKV